MRSRSRPFEQAKAPVQTRSRDRVESVLGATAVLLEDRNPDELTIATIAEQAGIGRASVYQFFPTVFAIYRTLALRFLDEHAGYIKAHAARLDPQGWADALDAVIDASADLFNARPTGRKLLLGGGGRYELRLMDKDYDIHAASLIEELYGEILPPLPQEEGDPIKIVVVMVAAIFALGVHEDARIGPATRAQAKRAARGYFGQLGAM
jgi:AcrR family transcriptional regulator